MRGRIRGRTLFAPLVLLLVLTGCEDLIRKLTPVVPADGEVPLPDAAIGADGPITEKLTITGAKPDHGPFVGGTTVVLSGSGFALPMKVLVGGKAVQDAEIRVLSPIGVEIITPAGKVGPADIEVTKGDETVTLKTGFYYDPIVIDPNSGPTAGGTLVTILGSGTDFTQGMKLELGGVPMVDVQVISSTRLDAKTPPNGSGPADLVFGEKGTDRVVAEAYTYYDSTNPKTGGMGGGPLKGTLTVSTLNWLNRAPVPGATVVVQKERKLELQKTTDAKGVAVFSDPLLTGKVTVTAGKTDFESSTIVQFDARDVTIFMMPIAKPQPGPLPPGTQAGAVTGHVLFGGTTGAGSPLWKLVPEPKTGQTKRVYVFASTPSIAWGPPSPSDTATIDYQNDGSTAWPYTLVGYAGAMAIYAVAGLYNTDTMDFDPYAMGVTRGVVVGPGETAKADVWINVPLTEKVKIELKDAPQAMGRHSVSLAVDLGADGVILLPEWQLEGDGVFASEAVSRLPLFSHPGLTDATFTVDVVLESSTASGLPLTRATERAVMPQGGALLVDAFVGVPLQIKPAPGGKLQGNTIAWDQKGAKHDLSVTVLQLTDETPVWRIISPGDVTQVSLPDPITFGLPEWPNSPVVWLQWLARLPGFDYNSYTYAHLGSAYWDRWSFDELGFEVP